jgi:hypothetical protein
MTHPPVPWRLHGELLIVPTGATSGLFLATYRGGTLDYHELIVFGRGLVVAHIYVDDERSLSGGREIWRLPKQLAEFDVSHGRFVARRGGELLVDARVRRRRGFMPLPLLAPARGAGALAVGRGQIRAAPALVTLTGRFLTGTRLALAGDGLALTMPPPLLRW